MSDLRTRALQQADLDKDAQFTGANTSLVNSIMSRVYGSLYSVVASAARRYFESSELLTTTGTAQVGEPVDHLSTVDTILRVLTPSSPTTSRLRRLRQIGPQERARWAGRTGHARRWEMVDDQINLYPTPPAGDVYEIRYIAQPPDLSTFADSDAVDVVCPEGEEFFVWACAVAFLAKIKSDVTLALQEREAARERLKEWAIDRSVEDKPQGYIEEDDEELNLRTEGSFWFDPPL